MLVENKLIKGFDIGEKFRLNPIIYCKCGCGKTLFEYDKLGRPRTRIYRNHLDNPTINCACGCGEQLSKLDETNRSRKYIQGHYQKTHKPMLGKHHTEESKQKLSVKHSGKKLSGYTKNKISETLTGIIRSEENRHNISLGLTGIKRSEETNEKNRIAAYNRKYQHERFSNTKPERMLKCLLSITCIPYESQKKLYGRPDIFIEPNICIFEDGDYYHQNPDYLKHKNCPNYLFNKFGNVKTSKQIWDHDKKVTKKLEDQGYKVIRIWEHEVYEDPMGCLEKMRGD